MRFILYSQIQKARVSRHAFERLSFPNLVALIQPANTASIRVAEKAGIEHQYDTVYEGQSMRLYEVKSNNKGVQADSTTDAADP